MLEIVAAMTSEDDWNALVDAIEGQRCVLFLGPGVAITADEVPLCDRLAAALAAGLSEEQRARIGKHRELAHVAGIFADPPGDRVKLELAVDRFYKEHAAAPVPSLHQCLARLPFALAVTTTFERFLHRALAALANEPAREAHHTFKLPAAKQPPTPTEGFFVYELLGSLRDRRSLVLTENDIIEFLIRIAADSEQKRFLTHDTFEHQDTSFLFLGFGFRHWYWRMLLHILNKRSGGRPRPSFALENQAFFDLPDYEQSAVFFDRGHRVQFRPFADDFVAELQRRVRPAARPRSEIPYPGRPLVFLSYVREDLEKAEELQADLLRREINVWMDTSDLPGGVEWDKYIESTINRVDYVISLQSSQLLGRHERYAWKEYKLALKRAMEFRPALRSAPEKLFLIPVLLERHPDLPIDDLRGFHAPLLTEPGAVDRLVETIRDDWQLRPQQRVP